MIENRHRRVWPGPRRLRASRSRPGEEQRIGSLLFPSRDGEDLLLDPEGRELDCDSAITAAALADARSIISHDAMAGEIRLDQRIDVEDIASHLVHRLHFADAVLIVPATASSTP